MRWDTQHVPETLATPAINYCRSTHYIIAGKDAWLVYIFFHAQHSSSSCAFPFKWWNTVFHFVKCSPTSAASLCCKQMQINPQTKILKIWEASCMTLNLLGTWQPCVNTWCKISFTAQSQGHPVPRGHCWVEYFVHVFCDCEVLGMSHYLALSVGNGKVQTSVLWWYWCYCIT